MFDIQVCNDVVTRVAFRPQENNQLPKKNWIVKTIVNNVTNIDNLKYQ